MAIDKNGKTHAIELASKTDMPPKRFADLTSRNEKAMNNLPLSKQGEIIVFAHKYNHRHIKLMLDDLIAGI